MWWHTPRLAGWLAGLFAGRRAGRQAGGRTARFEVSVGIKAPRILSEIIVDCTRIWGTDLLIPTYNTKHPQHSTPQHTTVPYSETDSLHDMIVL
jgi:hypothetical protein